MQEEERLLREEERLEQERAFRESLAKDKAKEEEKRKEEEKKKEDELFNKLSEALVEFQKQVRNIFLNFSFYILFLKRKKRKNLKKKNLLYSLNLLQQIQISLNS